ncbi:MAG: hypothetical protein ACUVYA_00660 [Planctomycetota bacterium]
MRRCPRCGERPPKRDCPALGLEICAACCARDRLREIPCPSSCPHLENESYQEKRRQDRAQSRGREFLFAMAELTDSDEAFHLALWLQAHTYIFLFGATRREDAGDDAAVARAYAAAAEAYSPLVLPEGGRHPLTALLLERLNGRDPERPGVPPEECRRLLRRLSEYAASVREKEGRGYGEALESYYGPLSRKRAAPGGARSAEAGVLWRPGSRLIVPG